MKDIIKVAIIGLDTSHSVEFPRRMQAPDCPEKNKVEGLRSVTCLRFETPFTNKEVLDERQKQLEAWGVKVTDDWDAQCVMPSSAAIYRPDGIYFYFSGSAYDHSGPTKIPYSKIGKECIGMARLRPDGFVELEAREDVCELMSRPFMVRSGELYINASVCPTGYVLAEVSDTKGDPIEGFSFSDCVPCKGDNTACRITWNGSPNLSHIEEKIIRLKIRAKKATLYSMFFPNGNNLADYWKFREISCLNPKFDLEDF
jgi:hypothetical protein